MPRRILSKTKSKIEAERRDKYFNIWLGRGGYPFSYTVRLIVNGGIAHDGLAAPDAL